IGKMKTQYRMLLPAACTVTEEQRYRGGPFACLLRANATRSSSGKAVEIARRKRSLPTTDNRFAAIQRPAMQICPNLKSTSIASNSEAGSHSQLDCRPAH